MFAAIRDFFDDMMPTAKDGSPTFNMKDKRLSAAVLMAYAIAADGKVTIEEQKKLLSVLQKHYKLSGNEADLLADKAREAQARSVDFFQFTNSLKNQMDMSERLGLIEDMWEMVYADGELHEQEDNLVWRVAELLNVTSEQRMALKRIVRDRLAGA